MTNEEYFEKVRTPLTEEEKQLVRDAGWEFIGDDYIQIPDDYDGSFASGVDMIRRVLMRITNRDLFLKHSGRMKDIYEELEEQGRDMVRLPRISVQPLSERKRVRH